ncbi:MAG: 7-cyano-7-deazaguanine synthase QueC [Gammaproteobacteria bacterium]|nr:7-cyano-7-deazaguanine synthase QueC [Gammaproteobacteria bacterium]
MRKAVVLFSGGLDSTTCMAIARSQGFELYALTFQYGQKHSAEVNAAKRAVSYFEAKEHRIITIDIGQFGHSALTDQSIDVPDYSGAGKIPATYVPARNTIFLSYALAYAEIIGSTDIFSGNCSTDHAGYPDCKPEYFAAYQTMARLATKAGVEGELVTFHTPLMMLTKADTIRIGSELGVDYSKTVTCYRASDEGEACGRCDACVLRRCGFETANIPDSTRYAANSTVV